MSLYHETCDILSGTTPTNVGGNLKSRIFSNQKLKSPPGQVYALALETCKWSPVLKEVIEKSDLLRLERKLTPLLSLLLVHDFLLAKGGIALPSSHGLRASIERHKARLSSDFARARIRRQAGTTDALRGQIDAQAQSGYPRWVRINTLVTCLEDQLETTFADFEHVFSIKSVVVPGKKKLICIDPHVPNLIATSANVDITKTEAYSAGAIILQDKASCFPAYLLNPGSEDGDVMDACAAPGNKTTHLAAIVSQHHPDRLHLDQTVFGCERDENRAKTLDRMVRKAAADGICSLNLGQDFLKLNPEDGRYKKVGALLLDPSCSGSGMVGRDYMPDIHLPEDPAAGTMKRPPKPDGSSKKRKRSEEERDEDDDKKTTMIDDDGTTRLVASDRELEERLEALSSFQLTLLLHAFKFPNATKITYSTCSIHAKENEDVVLKALQSEIAKERGWEILPRQDQVRGMREWPLRGVAKNCDGDECLADAVIRTYKDDGRGVMGFFVAAFRRDPPSIRKCKEGNGNGKMTNEEQEEEEEGPYVRDESRMILRDPSTGMPVLKSTGQPIPLPEEVHIRAPMDGDGNDDEDGDNCPYVKDEDGMVVRDEEGMPFLKRKKTETGLRPGRPLETVAEEDEEERAEMKIKDGNEDAESWLGFGD